jgi:hypothetical protein
MPISVVRETKVINADDGMFSNEREGWIPDFATKGVIVRDDIKVVILDNGLMRVTVSPTLGMRVLDAVDLTTGSHLFHVKDTLQGHRVWDVGGVEASWPMYEHGLHLLDEPGSSMPNPAQTPFQSGKYRIVRESDGSVSVAMRMEFFQYQSRAESAIGGRYSDRPLSSWVTLIPGAAKFSVSYRVDNPNPTPRSDRLWNDALFTKGSPDAQIVFPSRWAVDHATDGVFDMDTCRDRAQSFYYDQSRKMYSMFALYAEYPFCGVWYPEEQVNRVRIHDPKTAPGMKCFVHAGVDFIEFWGGTGVVFETPGELIGAYEPTQFSNTYFATPNIGKLSYADEYLALGVDTAAQTFRLYAPICYDVTVEDFSGTSLAIGTVGPNQPVLFGTCPSNEIVVRSGEKELLRASFPLNYPDNYDRLAPLRQSSLQSITAWKLPDLSYKKAYDSRRGLNYELEMVPNNTYVLRDYHALQAANNVSENDTPEYILSLARVCYRHRKFATAEALCDRVAEKGIEHEKEAAYIRTLIAWERGDTLDFVQNDIRANYHHALWAIQRNEKNRAVSLLDEYCSAYPKKYRPALLRALLTEDIAAARSLLDENPGSIEALYVLKELGVTWAADDLEGMIEVNSPTARTLNRFISEATLGKWTHVPRWVHIE